MFSGNYIDKIRASFDFLVSEQGFISSSSSVQWDDSVVYKKKHLSIKVNVGDKDTFFNILVKTAGATKAVPLWAICRSEKLKTGALTGTCFDNENFAVYAENSAEALRKLMPKLTKYGPVEQRKAKIEMQRNLKERIQIYGW